MHRKRVLKLWTCLLGEVGWSTLSTPFATGLILWESAHDVTNFKLTKRETGCSQHTPLLETLLATPLWTAFAPTLAGGHTCDSSTQLYVMHTWATANLAQMSMLDSTFNWSHEQMTFEWSINVGTTTTQARINCRFYDLVHVKVKPLAINDTQMQVNG